MRTRRTAAVVTAAALLTLAGCSGDPASTGAPSPTPSPTDSTKVARTDDPSDGATQGTRRIVEAGTDLLTWKAAPGAVADTVTVAGAFSLTVDEQGTRAQLEGPRKLLVNAGGSGRIARAQLDGDHAMVVVADRQEQRPATATVLDLATGERTVFNAFSPVPTISGGTWALGAGRVAYASYDGNRYCLAESELASGNAELTWCAPKRHGFNQARITPQGLTLLTFDDSQPSCRTVAAVSGAKLEPFPGVRDCVGWDGVLLDGGRVWSQVPKPSRIDSAHFYAAVGDAAYDLGPGTSGSLVECGGAAYFSRDPSREGGSAQVLRWVPTGQLDIVYEAPAGRDGFVTVPLRCGGSDLTVTALTSAGDEQVTASLR